MNIKKILILCNLFLFFIAGCTSPEPVIEYVEKEVFIEVPVYIKPPFSDSQIIEVIDEVLTNVYPNNSYNLFIKDNCLYIDMWQEYLQEDLIVCQYHNNYLSWDMFVETTCMSSQYIKSYLNILCKLYDIIWNFYDKVEDEQGINDILFITVFNGEVKFNIKDTF